MEPMLAPTYGSGRDVAEEIIYIEYQRHGRQWLPHSVISEHSNYDFDVVAGGDLCQHMSGGGGNREGIDLATYCAAPKLCAKVWFNPEKTKLLFEGKPVTRQIAKSLGYQIVKEPIGGNPFDLASYEGDTEWCAVCNERYHGEGTCRHIKRSDGGGFDLGCGASDVDLVETHLSLCRLLRVLSPEHRSDLMKSLRSPRFFAQHSDSMLGGDMNLNISPFGPRIYCEPLGEELNYEERYWPGIAWLHSLDTDAKEPLALTIGWLWAWEHSNWQSHCVLGERHFYRDIGPSIKDWLAIDPHDPSLLHEKPFVQRLNFKSETRNCSNFKRQPDKTVEVTLCHRTGKAYRSVTFSVAEVKQLPRNSVGVYFGRMIENDGTHISELPDYPFR